jgi:two-component system response regulator MprA
MDSHEILIVDDDPNVLELLRVNLASQGYLITTAHNGVEALAAIGQRVPELMILDVMMPEMDGWEVCKLVRDKYQAAIKILMLTAKDTARDKVIGKNILKADEYMTKPFDIDELLSLVKKLLSQGAS